MRITINAIITTLSKGSIIPKDNEVTSKVKLSLGAPLERLSELLSLN